MRDVVAQKTATQNMIEVTGIELRRLKILNPSISIGQYDTENTDMSSHNIVGYIAGDIEDLKLFEKDISLNKTADLWFINKEFFDKNYEEIS